MSWLDKVAFRQLFGGSLMTAAIGLAVLFHADGISDDEWKVVALIATVGGLVFDTKAAIDFVTQFPWPWRRTDAPEDPK